MWERLGWVGRKTSSRQRSTWPTGPTSLRRRWGYVTGLADFNSLVGQIKQEQQEKKKELEEKKKRQEEFKNKQANFVWALLDAQPRVQGNTSLVLCRPKASSKLIAILRISGKHFLPLSNPISIHRLIHLVWISALIFGDIIPENLTNFVWYSPLPIHCID